MFQVLLFDLDGTVYRGSKAIRGAPEFFKKLQTNKLPYLFLTNRCNRLPETISDHLNAIGIACNKNNVLTSAHAAAAILANKKVHVIGEIGLTQVLEDHQITITDQKPDAVVVGFDENINYKKLEKATRLIRDGARFIATNTDACINTDTGISPENGPIIAALQCATGVTPEIVGKPQPNMVYLAEQILKIPKDQMILIGDNPDTDILCGINAGIATALILTGITDAAEAPKRVGEKTFIIPDYSALNELIFKGK